MEGAEKQGVSAEAEMCPENSVILFDWAATAYIGEGTDEVSSLSHFNSWASRK